ncbi:hypothetical protein Ae717Ps2_7179c [Pseudonocardia sp. Ae717_Ps2]|nr:hypothetical protein Ae717Ps2_7179c [Pseudonocardia sp. Ae717_Ps2]
MVPEATCTVCESPGTRSQTRRHGFTASTDSGGPILGALPAPT